MYHISITAYGKTYTLMTAHESKEAAQRVVNDLQDSEAFMGRRGEATFDILKTS